MNNDNAVLKRKGDEDDYNYRKIPRRDIFSESPQVAYVENVLLKKIKYRKTECAIVDDTQIIINSDNQAIKGIIFVQQTLDDNCSISSNRFDTRLWNYFNTVQPFYHLETFLPYEEIGYYTIAYNPFSCLYTGHTSDRLIFNYTSSSNIINKLMVYEMML